RTSLLECRLDHEYAVFVSNRPANDVTRWPAEAVASTTGYDERVTSHDHIHAGVRALDKACHARPNSLPQLIPEIVGMLDLNLRDKGIGREGGGELISKHRHSVATVGVSAGDCRSANYANEDGAEKPG
ncbi:hypothetical protein, partial [Novosphingobium sp.]|uniref:hypothetical protein n=1 Tax=Novosphingobium sp. TaxID=1874826 RepID=UPI002609C43F